MIYGIMLVIAIVALAALILSYYGMKQMKVRLCKMEDKVIQIEKEIEQIAEETAYLKVVVRTLML